MKHRRVPSKQFPHNRRLQLTDELAKRLDFAAKACGTSVAELLRQYATEGLDSDRIPHDADPQSPGQLALFREQSGITEDH